jgi:hypothetical protein
MIPLARGRRLFPQSGTAEPPPDVVACAALLHDAVEDRADDVAPGGREAALAALAGQFGALGRDR